MNATRNNQQPPIKFNQIAQDQIEVINIPQSSSCSEQIEIEKQDSSIQLEHSTKIEPFFQLMWTYMQFSNDFRNLAIFCFFNFAISMHAFCSGIIVKNKIVTEQSFECFINCFILIFVIFAGIRAKHYPKSPQFPFALQSLESLSSFTMCLYLLLLCIFHLMRNLHMIFEESEYLQEVIHKHKEETEQMLFYNYLRIILSLSGMICFIEYQKLKSIYQKDQQYQTFKQVFRKVILMNKSAFYENHYINFHGVFLYFLSDVQLNIGQCIESVLSHYIQFHAACVVAILLNLFIIFRFIKPLLKESTLSLLLAEPSQYINQTKIIKKIESVQGVKKATLQVWGQVALNCRNVIVNLQVESNVSLKDIREEVRRRVSDSFAQIWINL